MILAILAFIWGYRKGRDTGRSPALWSVICGFTFLGVQLLFSLGIGILLGIGVVAFDWNERIIDDYSLIISIVALVPAGLALWGIFKYLDHRPVEPVLTEPPPPPTFTGI